MVDRSSNLAATMVAFTLLLVPAILRAQAPSGTGGAEPSGAAEQAEQKEEEAAGPNRGRISFLMQSDFTNAYIFRGIMQERDGFIWQPFFELTVKLHESDEGPLRGASVGMGIWNSVQSQKTLATHSPRILYETDWYPMIGLDFPMGFSLLTTYFAYTSPNGAFDTVSELDFKLGWDDSEALGRWALSPTVNFAVELDGTSFGDQSGSGVGLAIAPTLYELENEDFPLSFSFPVELGLSIDNYYELPGGPNDTFGYLAWGLTASLPITAVPAEYGAWSVNVGGKGYYFSETLATANSNDRLYPTVTGSLVIEY